jgi:hypothetical protein
MTEPRSSIPAERIERAILFIRGHKVMLSTDLAGLYGVEPRALVQAVKRNMQRFPPDFMFHLSTEEREILKSQNVISSAVTWGGARALERKYDPPAKLRRIGFHSGEIDS